MVENKSKENYGHFGLPLPSISSLPGLGHVYFPTGIYAFMSIFVGFRLAQNTDF